MRVFLPPTPRRLHVWYLFRLSHDQQASSSKKAAPGASEDEVERLMLKQADESLRKAQEEIERNIGKL